MLINQSVLSKKRKKAGGGGDKDKEKLSKLREEAKINVSSLLPDQECSSRGETKAWLTARPLLRPDRTGPHTVLLLVYDQARQLRDPFGASCLALTGSSNVKKTDESLFWCSARPFASVVRR